MSRVQVVGSGGWHGQGHSSEVPVSEFTVEEPDSVAGTPYPRPSTTRSGSGPASSTWGAGSERGLAGRRRQHWVGGRLSAAHRLAGAPHRARL